MTIWGAGLAGLLAGTQFQKATIIEAGPPETVNHTAVLRFRSRAIADAIGIDFRPVTVHKGIWYAGKFVQPDIRYANWYSQKVIGKLHDRSIWNLAPAERYIAPPDFHNQLAERCAGRIRFNCIINKAHLPENPYESTIISTIPMNVMVGMLGSVENHSVFKYASIDVRRWRVHGADVFQTVYFPNPLTRLYRASMTGDLLTAEYMNSIGQDAIGEEPYYAFGLVENQCQEIERPTHQRYGKIEPLADDNWRKQFIFELTQHRNIFSLGRFATWRNILLDDVLHDIAIIKRMIGLGQYDRARQMSRSQS